MSDKEVIHRWLTQAELDEMIEWAFNEGVAEMHRAAQKVLQEHGHNDVERRLAIATLDIRRHKDIK